MAIEPTIRTRDIVTRERGNGHQFYSYMDTVLRDEDLPVGQVGRETTRSLENPDWKQIRHVKRQWAKRNPGKPYPSHLKAIFRNTDAGNGAFESVKQWVEGSPRDISINHVRGSYRYFYAGPWYAREANVEPGSNLFPTVSLSGLTNDMLVKGAVAIARTIPTNPVAGAAQFLGELREGVTLPGASYVRDGGIPGLASEYVNYEFGVKPIISDLQKFGEAVRTSREVLRQLQRDSGRLVRRRYSFPVERVVEPPVVTNGSGSPVLVSSGDGAYTTRVGKLTRTRTIERKFWFSAGYTYYLNPGLTATGRLARTEQNLAKLFGTRVSPELVWELTPWSWLADWSSNMGDLVHNFSALSRDSLVMRYGYMMSHVTVRDTYLLDGVVLRGGIGGPLSQVFVTDVKKRIRATPYGFGLDTDGFTTRQKAILAALGIARSGKK